MSKAIAVVVGPAGASAWASACSEEDLIHSEEDRMPSPEGRLEPSPGDRRLAAGLVLEERLSSEERMQSEEPMEDYLE